MITADKPSFAKIMFGLGEYFGKQISQPVIDIYWRVLENYDLRSIDRAVSVILANPDASPFMPKANEIIAAMPREAGSQWLSADEAWAHVVAAYDENNSVVFPSDEAQKAWHQAAQPIFNPRDQSPARMAFRASYERMVNDSRAMGVRPKAKFVSGFEPAQRIEVAQKYIALGVLEDADVPEYILLEAPDITPEGRAIAGLLGCDTPLPEVLPDDFRSRYEKLREVIKTTKSPEEIRADLEAIKRADREQRKAETLKALRGQL